ncbi:MAG: phage holin family protein [Rhodocyclaceae bacterium]
MSSATPGAGNEAAGNAGLFSALRNVATTLVATARTRVELAGNDLELERLRLVRALIFGLSALFCFGVGLLMLIGLVLILNWESRVVVLAAFGGGFLAAGAILYAAMKRANSRRQAFAATIAELEEDLRQLRAAADHAQKGS